MRRGVSRGRGGGRGQGARDVSRGGRGRGRRRGRGVSKPSLRQRGPGVAGMGEIQQERSSHGQRLVTEMWRGAARPRDPG